MNQFFIRRLLFSFCVVYLLLHGSLLSQQTDTISEWIDRPVTDSIQASRLLDFSLTVYREYPEKALKSVNQSYQFARKSHNPYLLSRAYSIQGMILKNKGQYAEALANHLKSKTINDSLGKKNALASNYNDIGIVYKLMKEYDKALDSYRQANALSVELDLKKGVVMTLNNMGTIYEAKGDNQNAIIYYERALDKANEYEIDDAKAIALNNLGETYASLGNNKKAKEYFKKTLTIDLRSKDKIGSIYSMLNIAGTFIGEKKYDSAALLYLSSEATAREMGANQLLIHVYYGLTKVYEDNKDYKNALHYQKLITLFQDSLYNETRARQLAEVESKYESLKKDREIDALKQEQFIQDLKIEQHKAERIAWLSLFFIGIFILYYLYKRFRIRQKEIFTRQLLQQKESHLRAVVEAQENERKRIAKDLHDGVGQTLSGIRLAMQNLSQQIKTLSQDEKEKMSTLTNIVDGACTEVRSISHQMMPRVLQQEGLIPALADMLEKSFRLSPIHYNFENFGIESRFAESIEIGLYRIAQELINNIIKHSEANEVSVQLFKASKTLVLLIEDNGKGFVLNDLKRKGIGLMNISSRVETIHGEFNLEPSPQSGTLATIRIPIEK